jgi:L-lactate dehydrogenase complex protein LldF
VLVEAEGAGVLGQGATQGLERQGELAEASTLCGACAEVCPVRIPIPRLLNRLRFERAAGTSLSGAKRPGRQRHLWRGWAAMHASPRRYRWLTRVATRVAGPLIRGPLAAALGPWGRSRAAPVIAAQSLHELARQDGFTDD